MANTMSDSARLRASGDLSRMRKIALEKETTELQEKAERRKGNDEFNVRPRAMWRRDDRIGDNHHRRPNLIADTKTAAK